MPRPHVLLLLSACAWSLHPYRVVFRDVHAAFRTEDIHSAAHDLGGRVEHVSATSARLHLPEDAAAATLAERSVLVRYVLEEWGAGATLRERRRHEGERRVHRRRASVTSVRDAVLAQQIGCAAAGYYSSYHNFLASHKHGHVFLGAFEPHGARERVQDAAERLEEGRVVGVHEARASSWRLDPYAPRRAVGKRTVWRYACS